MTTVSSTRRIVVILFLVVALSTAFVPSVPLQSASNVALFASKGFGSKPSKRVKSEGQVKREQEASRYDEISSEGGQEYNIFVRQFGSDDKSWFPCGSVAVPRAAQVSDAIYSNVEELKKAIVRTYPRLKGFEAEFEYGYNLKVYPDDPVEVAIKTNKKAGISVGNWISTLLSPVDASKPASPPPPPSS
jgi:Family of unknown function (DUF6523)